MENFNYYLEIIRKCQDPSIILNQLPREESIHFDAIMNKIVQTLKEEIYIYKELKNTALQENDIVECIENIKLFTKTLDEVYKVLDQKNNNDLKIVSQKEKRIIFAKNENNKIQFLKDLKDLEKNDNGIVKNEVISLIENLKNVNERYNLQKSRKLINDDSLRGVFEQKGFQIRLFYMYVGEYPVIIGVSQKKKNTEEKLKNSIQRKKISSEKFREHIKNNLENFEFMENLFDEALEIEKKMKEENIYDSKRK